MYNLSLPRLSTNYYGLPMTVQLRAAHKPMFTVRCLAANSPQVLYCTCLERYTLGPFMNIYILSTLVLVFCEIRHLLSHYLFCDNPITNICDITDHGDGDQ